MNSFFIKRLLTPIIFLIWSTHLLADSEPIKIGVSSALTGDAATYGQDIKNVIEFANKKIGNGRFELIFEDDKCNGKDAVAVAKKLVDIDKVKGVVGYGCSGPLLAAAPIFNRAKVPAIGTESSAAKISQAGEYIFRTQPSDRDGTKLLFDYWLKHHKTVGVLSAQTEFAQGIVDDLKDLSKSNKPTLVFENFLTSTSDHRTLLLKLKARNINGLFVNAQDEAGTYLIIKQAKELGINGPFYTFYMGASDSFIKVAGKDAEGVISVGGPSLEEITNSDGASLYNEFISEYGPMKAWNYGFATTFEAFRALTEALTLSSDPKRYLLSTKFNGIFGPYFFDRNGDINGISLVLRRVENGKAVTITP